MPEDVKKTILHMQASGRCIDLAAFTAEDVDLDDIAWGLSRIPRFIGNTYRPFTVVEHSIMVMEILRWKGYGPDVCFQGLMHDAGEYLLGDVPAPVKAMVPEIRTFEKNVIWPPIADRFGLPHQLHPSVHWADWVALYVEAGLLCTTADLKSWERYQDYHEPAQAFMKETDFFIDIKHAPHPDTLRDSFREVVMAFCNEMVRTELAK